MAASNISHHRGSIHSTTTVPTRKILPASLAASYSTPHISFYSFYLFSIQKPFKKQSKFQFEVIFSRISSPSALRAMATCVNEVLPPSLDSSSDPPAIFDGTTKLYISYICPYAQRVWITRNYKGLQNQIKLVPIDLQNRPSWYKEKVYPPNKVPSLEHNNEVKGESLDLIKYLEEKFEGPSLLPDDSAKREFAEELLSYTDTFNGAVISSFKSDKISEAGAAFDYIENALGKFDGPFLLGTFSLVDIAYVPFVERYQAFLLDVKKYDITEGRPKLAAWLEEINKIESYKVTKRDPKEYVESYKKRFLSQH